MATNMRSKILVGLLVVLVAIVLVFVYQMDFLGESPQAQQQPQPKQEQDLVKAKPAQLGTYTSEQYGFSFTYPETWRVGDNRLEQGTFQLMNYPEDVSPRDGIRAPNTKIEMSVHKTDDPTSFFLETKPQETTVAGQRALMATDKYGVPSAYISYAIEIPSHTGYYLIVSLGGDLKQQEVLESILNSIDWK